MAGDGGQRQRHSGPAASTAVRQLFAHRSAARPPGLGEVKWAFALVELLLLGGILGLTAAGSRLGWHRRWFAMRRVVEYLRRAPALLLLGVARQTGRWPRSGRHGDAAASWPEHFVRHALRDVGLPQMAVTRDYLRIGLGGAVLAYLAAQRTYHEAKARRLERVHHGLDKGAETCFVLAVASVTAYLAIKGAGLAGWVPKSLTGDLSAVFTFLGVAFPTLGANLSGIRYFGDFERFGAISRMAAEAGRNRGAHLAAVVMRSASADMCGGGRSDPRA